MILSLSVKFKNSGRKWLFVPVSTRQDFEEFWMPACQKLDLQWIPLFKSETLHIEPNTIPLLLDELWRLRDYVCDAGYEVHKALEMIRNIEKLISELRYVQYHWDEVVYARI